MPDRTPRYGIIGHPLGHTMSPPLHNSALAHFGLPGSYQAWPIPPEALADFVASMRRSVEGGRPILGVSVTIPHKQAVMEMLDSVTGRAGAIGAVNTLYWDDGRLVGENTDCAGFCDPFRSGVAEIPRSALILGAGGASRAAVAGLRELGVQSICITNRTAERAGEIARDFSIDVVAWDERADVDAELLVNATPLGMSGESVQASPYPAEAFRPWQSAYDLIYNPLRTRFLREAGQAGCGVIDGLSMFIGQGLEQFRLWTGKEYSRESARSLLAGLL